MLKSLIKIIIILIIIVIVLLIWLRVLRMILVKLKLVFENVDFLKLSLFSIGIKKIGKKLMRIFWINVLIVVFFILLEVLLIIFVVVL